MQISYYYSLFKNDVLLEYGTLEVEILEVWVTNIRVGPAFVGINFAALSCIIIAKLGHFLSFCKVS